MKAIFSKDIQLGEITLPAIKAKLQKNSNTLSQFTARQVYDKLHSEIDKRSSQSSQSLPEECETSEQRVRRMMDVCGDWRSRGDAAVSHV